MHIVHILNQKFRNPRHRNILRVSRNEKKNKYNKTSRGGEGGGGGARKAMPPPPPPPIKFSMMLFFVNCNLLYYILLCKRSRRCYCRLLLSFITKYYKILQQYAISTKMISIHHFWRHNCKFCTQNFRNAVI